MKKLVGILIGMLFLTGCGKRQSEHHSFTSSISSSAAKQAHKSSGASIKKYKNLKLMTIPEEFQGTWWRSDQFSKKARSLKIDSHSVNGSVLYYQTEKFRRDHNSEKQNKEYGGQDISVGQVTTLNNRPALRVWDILGTVDLVYLKGKFQGHDVLYLAYSSGDIHGALFKDAKLALKYRKYNFSNIK